jgi:hypothetical protein
LRLSDQTLLPRAAGTLVASTYKRKACQQKNPPFPIARGNACQTFSHSAVKKSPSADYDADHQSTPEKTKPIADPLATAAMALAFGPRKKRNERLTRVPLLRDGGPPRSELPIGRSKCRSSMQQHEESLNQKSLFLWHTYC